MIASKILTTIKNVLLISVLIVTVCCDWNSNSALLVNEKLPFNSDSLILDEGQIKHIEDFIKRFSFVSLPDTIQYSANEFDYGYYESENEEDNESTSSEYKNTVLAKPDSLIITYDLVKSFLLEKSEQLTEYWPENSHDTIFPTYYYSNGILFKNNFYCIVYEKQFHLEDKPFCQKYLCTLAKNGKLIDKIKVASADYSGTGILDEGFRIPWFPDEMSIINKDLKIYYFKEGIHLMTRAGSDKVELDPEIIYQIDNKGKINKIQ